MKGKYAAKAANRAAALDNSVIAELRADLAAAKDQIQTLKTKLAASEQEVSSRIIERADQLAADMVASANRRADDFIAERRDQLHWVAEKLTAYFSAQKVYPNVYIQDVLPALIPDTKMRSTHIDTAFFGGYERGETDRFVSAEDVQRWAREGTGDIHLTRDEDAASHE